MEHSVPPSRWLSTGSAARLCTLLYMHMPNVMQVKLAQQASFLDALKSSSPAEKAQIARQNSGFRKYALRRLTKIFHLSENSLRLSDRFGEELKSTFVSNVKKMNLIWFLMIIFGRQSYDVTTQLSVSA